MLNFKVFLESQVLAHVGGASGSGKTTLAKTLSTEFPEIIFKDLDDFDDEAEKLLGFKAKKKDYTDKMLQKLADKRQDLMDEFIENSKKPIVFVGHHTEGDYALKIPTKNKFLLNVDAKTSAYRAYLRSQKEGKHRRKLSELPSDEKEAQEVIDFLIKNDYKPLRFKQIKQWITAMSGK